MRQIILDTETTGLKPSDGHKIIEIGCVEVIDRRVTGRHYHKYLNPEREIDAGATAVHGKTWDMLRSEPRFADIVDELLDFLGQAQLIIHNAPFDMGFINWEMKTLRLPALGCEVLDTLPLARSRHPGQKNDLDSLCRRYQIDNTRRDLHGALLDAELLARVYLSMTGGQVSMLLDHEPAEQTSANAPTASNRHADILKNRPKLSVVQANPIELAAHQAYLEGLDKDSKGACLWLHATDAQCPSPNPS